MEVASHLLKGFPNGVWLVGFSALSDPELVPQVTAAALGVREAHDQRLTETLVNHLKTRHVLLALDNCEHLVEACAQMSETLLLACPNLRILATVEIRSALLENCCGSCRAYLSPISDSLHVHVFTNKTR